MSLALILIIIALGLGFLFVEVFLIPGTSVLAILGFVVIIIGVYLGYRNWANHRQRVGRFDLTVFCIVGAGLTMYIGKASTNGCNRKMGDCIPWWMEQPIISKVNVHDLIPGSTNFWGGEEGVDQHLISVPKAKPVSKRQELNDRRVNGCQSAWANSLMLLKAVSGSLL